MAANETVGLGYQNQFRPAKTALSSRRPDRQRATAQGAAYRNP